MVVLCLCALVSPGLFPVVQADGTAGYWNFSLETPQNLSATNATTSSGIPDTQSILPGDPLYSLKLSFEQLDLSFTANTTVRVEKSMHYTENRLVEADIALRENRTDAAREALAQYSTGLEATLHMATAMHRNATAPVHIQVVLSRHLAVLNDTVSRHQGNADLLAVYNRTAALATRVHERNSTVTHPAPVMTTRRPAVENRTITNRSAVL